MQARNDDNDKEALTPFKKKVANIREERYRKEQIKQLIKRFFVLILILVVVIIISASFLLVKNTKLNKIEYIGLKRLNALDIEYVANLVKYNKKSIYGVSAKKIREDVERHNLVRVKSIERHFPDTIIINIEEKPIIALLEHGGKIYEVTDDLILIRMVRVFSYDVPYLTGLSIDTNKSIIDDEYTKYLINTLTFLRTNDNNIYNMISEINAFDKDLVLYPRAYKTKVILEKNIKAEKLEKLSAILKTLQDTGKRASIIDFRFKDAILK